MGLSLCVADPDPEFPSETEWMNQVQTERGTQCKQDVKTYLALITHRTHRGKKILN